MKTQNFKIITGELLHYLIPSFVLCFIAMFVNVSQIPSGDGLGGLGEFIICVFYSILIYFISVLISYSLWSKNYSNRILLLVLIHLTAIISIYIICWYTCIYRVGSLSRHDMIELDIKDLYKYRQVIKKIPNLIKDEEVFIPKREVYVNDSAKINSALVSFFKKPYNEMDTITKRNVSGLIDFNESTFFGDSLFTVIYLNSVHPSIRVRNIFYSPKEDILICFVSFTGCSLFENKKIVCGGDALVLIGRKHENKISLYKFYHYPYADYLDAEMALSSTFMSLLKADEDFLSKDFWSKKRYFSVLSFDNTNIYAFQNSNWKYVTKLTLRKPILIANDIYKNYHLVNDK